MKAVILAIVAFGTLAIVLARSSTGATFTDQATSTGNTFASATMAPPTGLSASLGVDGETVTLHWTATLTSFAPGYDEGRGTATGTYGTHTSISPASTTTTSDIPPRPANTVTPSYYYALRSVYQNWVSGYSNEVSVKPLDHFAVTNTSGGAITNQTAGTAFSVKVAAQTADNFAISNFTGTVALAGSSGSGCTATPASQALSAGIATYGVTCTTAATGVSLTATYSPAFPLSSRTGVSNTFDVAAAGSSVKLNGDLTLVTGAATGGPIVVEATQSNTGFKAWSKSSVTATSHSGWSVTLNVGQNAQNNFNPSGTLADVVVYLIGSGTCSTTAPSAANTLASALLVPIVIGNVPVSLTSSGTLSTPSPGTLCLRVTNHSSDSGNAHDFSVTTTGLSALTGPF